MIELATVKQVYTGRQGCACGCRGKYSIASSFGVERANKETGWNAFERCSDRAVKMAVNKINALIDWDDRRSRRPTIGVEHGHPKTKKRVTILTLWTCILDVHFDYTS